MLKLMLDVKLEATRMLPQLIFLFHCDILCVKYVLSRVFPVPVLAPNLSTG